MDYRAIKSIHEQRAAVMSNHALDEMSNHLEQRRAKHDSVELLLVHGCYLSEIIERRNRNHPNYNGWHEDVSFDDESLSDYHDRMRRRDEAFCKQVARGW